VKSDFSALLGYFCWFSEAHFLKEGISWHFMVFLLKEGVTTRVCMVISQRIVSIFLQNFLIEWL
jgi:hypothetical protein